MSTPSPYCERCDRDVPYLMSNGFTDPWGRDVSELWCWECVASYDGAPWETDSEDYGPRDEAHRMQEAWHIKNDWRRDVH